MKLLICRVLNTSFIIKAASVILKCCIKPDTRAAVVIHTEKIYDDEVFKALVKLCKNSSVKPLVCIVTPKNPYIKYMMDKVSLSESEYSKRVKELSEISVIGYHGHWCKKKDSFKPYRNNYLSEIERAGFSLTMDSPQDVSEQFVAEYDYIKNICGAPKVYCGGWWYMDKTIVQLLEKYNFISDCTLRNNVNTFGDKQEPGYKISNNKCVITGSNVEAYLSTDYIFMNWWSLVKSLRSLSAELSGGAKLALPLHDYNIIGNENKIEENFNILTNKYGIKIAGEVNG